MSKIYIITGEHSGDFVGSKIMQQLKARKPQISFTGIGGKLMQEVGMSSLFPMEQISIIGFFEILPHIFKLIKLIKYTTEDIVKAQPDILITIDSPGFTYRVAKAVRAVMPSLKILHIVAPSVWAYKPRRAEKYAKIYNHLLALLPFEPPYFTKLGLDCSYIGHPILEQKFYPKELSNELSICVTAGSRKGEIIRHMPVFATTLNILSQKYPEIKVVFVLASLEHQFLIEPFVKNMPFTYSYTIDRLQAYANATIALAKSGTNTIEIAASGTPMIVAYKVNFLSYFIIRALIRIKYVTLINIINNKEVIPEFLQFHCTAENIAGALIKLFESKTLKTKQVKTAMSTLNTLGYQQKIAPSAQAAEIILRLL